MNTEFGDFELDYEIPVQINYDIKRLKKFIEKDPEPVLIFYGGEPMLCNDKIIQIMDNVPSKQFNIQTNGLHLNKLKKEYLQTKHNLCLHRWPRKTDELLPGKRHL